MRNLNELRNTGSPCRVSMTIMITHSMPRSLYRLKSATWRRSRWVSRANCPQHFPWSKHLNNRQQETSPTTMFQASWLQVLRKFAIIVTKLHCQLSPWQPMRTSSRHLRPCTQTTSFPTPRWRCLTKTTRVFLAAAWWPSNARVASRAAPWHLTTEGRQWNLL